MVAELEALRKIRQRTYRGAKIALFPRRESGRAIAEAGTHIQVQGEVPSHLLLILTGAARSYMVTEGLEQTCALTTGPSTEGVFDGIPNLTSTQVLRDSAVEYVALPDLPKWLKNPSNRDLYQRSLAHRVRDGNEYRAMILQKTMGIRLANCLWIISGDENTPLPINQATLASIAHLTRPTANYLIRDLRRCGLVRVPSKGSIEILNVEGLYNYGNKTSNRKPRVVPITNMG